MSSSWSYLVERGCLRVLIKDIAVLILIILVNCEIKSDTVC